MSTGTAVVARWRQYPPVERVAYHLARARAWGRRATGWGLGLRAVIWLAGFAAVLVVLAPTAWLGRGAVVAAVLALLPMASPGSGRVAWLEVATVALVGLVAATTATGLSLPALVLVGSLLYLHHTTAALAAQLRTDTVVAPVLLRRWAIRAGGVIAGSAVLSAGLAALPGRAPAWPAGGYLVLGVGAALVLAAAVVWQLRR